MKILIIEDQEKLAQLLKKGLKREGITADYVLDGEAGQKRIEIHHRDYDLIVLDLMLPKRSGLEVCTNVRELGVATPILVLTAKDDVQDKINLLNAGADDYLSKPFSFDELLARIRAILRRPKPSYNNTEIKAGDFVLIPRTRKITYKDKELILTLKEFSILEYFMRHPNQVVSREELITNSWDFDVDAFNNVVDVYINRLRNKIEKGRSEKRLDNVIETVRGVGYRLKVKP